MRKVKVTVEKRSNRAGATPLLCGQAAQKFLGVAPALDALRVRLFPRWGIRASKVSCTLY